MWPFSKKARSANSAHGLSGSTASGKAIFFTNTLSGRKENFIPIKPGVATMYSCGFTVYSKAHIGNIRPYIFSDTIARALKQNGYHVRRVINITDVGHLVSDGDDGEDKMEVGAKREGTTAEEIATRYTTLFLQDLRAVNLDTNDILFPKATQYIPEQIALVKILEEKGMTYETSDGVYFDTSKFPDYGKLGGLSDEAIKHGDSESIEERVALAGRTRLKEFTSEKRNPADFALWKFSPPMQAGSSKRQQEWPSPFGHGRRGFPGWHLECSAMVRALLGDTIDIHTGGIDHIPVHHNNEIAQSESALNHPFVHYWMHNAFLTIEGQKISKSIGNTVYLSDIVERGFHPLALRYFFLQAHYNSTISFSWDTLAASQEALNRLWRLSATAAVESKGISVPTDAQKLFMQFINDDLSTPQALALLWEVMRDDEVTPKEKLGLLEVADPILGLSLLNPPESARKRTMEELPDDIRSLVKDREKARLAHDFEKADTIRGKLEIRGYRVEDGSNGPLLTLSAPTPK
jgi:cysteinyl-tRNA synthetase